MPRCASLPFRSDAKLAYSALYWRPREPLNDFNELVVCSATCVAKLFDFMFVRKSVRQLVIATLSRLPPFLATKLPRSMVPQTARPASEAQPLRRRPSRS